MNLIKWVGFGLENATTSTAVHFYPSSGNITAPYPAQVKLALFGSGVLVKTVTIEGARLSHPEGVRVRELFADVLSAEPGVFGLVIELYTHQSRIELDSSLCLIEICSQASSVKFWPVAVHKIGTPRQRIGIALHDSYNKSSIVTVNFGSRVALPKVSLLAETGTDEESGLATPRRDLSPFSAEEVICSGEDWEKAPKYSPVYVEQDQSDTIVSFMLYKDRKTSRPMSVVAL